MVTRSYPILNFKKLDGWDYQVTLQNPRRALVPGPASPEIIIPIGSELPRSPFAELQNAANLLKAYLRCR